MKSKGRIDWLISQFEIQGGAEKMVLSCAPRLKAAGWDIRLISLTGEVDALQLMRKQDVPVLALNIPRKSNPANIIQLLNIWKQDRPLLVHTHLFHAGIIGRIFGRFAGIPIVVVHQHGPELDRNKLRSLLDRTTSGWVARYVVSCQAVGRIMQAREGIPAEKIVVVQNGIETTGESAGNQKSPQPPARNETPCLIYAGRLSAEKGLLTLVEACALLRESGINFRCFILGNGPQRSEIQLEIGRLELEESVILPGLQSDLSEWYQKCDIFVLPSLWEGASLALLEAMAAGLPAVATATGGTPEIVADGVTGILVPPANPPALASALTRLLRSPELRTEMGLAGKRLVRAKYQIEYTVKMLSAFYMTLLGAG